MVSVSCVSLNSVSSGEKVLLNLPILLIRTQVLSLHLNLMGLLLVVGILSLVLCAHVCSYY